MKEVYMYDKNRQYVNLKIVENEYVLQDGETETRPKDGMYKAVWDGGEWVETGTPPEQKPPQPTEQEAIAEYLLDLDYRLTLIEMGV